jgi:hypothetical protein
MVSKTGMTTALYIYISYIYILFLFSLDEQQSLENSANDIVLNDTVRD